MIHEISRITLLQAAAKSRPISPKIGRLFDDMPLRELIYGHHTCYVKSEQLKLDQRFMDGYIV